MKTFHRICLAASVLIFVASAPLHAASAPRLSAQSVNKIENTMRIGPGAKGAVVLRAQILLDRARFSVGEIDGAYGSNMRRAILGLQAANGIKETGTVDAETWAILNADTADALVAYTVQESDTAGPFLPIPAGMAAMAAMPALGYASVQEGLGERFHISPAFLKRLNQGKNLSRTGEEILVPNVADAAPLPKAAKIVITKSRGTLVLLDNAGKIIAQFPASTGSDRDPLPIGTWKIKGVAKNPVFMYNPKLFWDASSDDKKAKIPAGPNNPVGVAWVDLTKEHYGIHGTPVPSAIGKTQSHGCIRLTNWDVMALSQAVAFGIPAVLEE